MAKKNEKPEWFNLAKYVVPQNKNNEAEDEYNRYLLDLWLRNFSIRKSIFDVIEQIRILEMTNDIKDIDDIGDISNIGKIEIDDVADISEIERSNDGVDIDYRKRKKRILSIQIISGSVKKCRDIGFITEKDLDLTDSNSNSNVYSLTTAHINFLFNKIPDKYKNNAEFLALGGDFSSSKKTNPKLSTLFLSESRINDSYIGVNLNAPKRQIRKHFEEWLNEQEEKKVLITEQAIRKWSSSKILAYMDLLIWEKLRKLKASNSKKIDWLFSDNTDIDVDDTIEKLRKSLKKINKTDYHSFMYTQL